MKLLRLIRSVNPEGGGPIEGVKQSSAVLISDGHDIELVSLDDPSESFVHDCPVKVHALGPVKSNYGYSPKFIPWLKANVGNYDAVIVQGIWQYHSYGAWRVLKNRSIPYFVFTHGMLDPWFKEMYPLKHLKKWLYWPWAEYRVLRDANAVLFTTEQEKQLARKSFWMYKCSEAVVNYGTSKQGGDSKSQKGLFYSAFPQTVGKRNLLYLSRIHPKKGCDLLIKAFAKVAKDDDNLHLIMAGPDQVGWRKELEILADTLDMSSRITWTGMLKGDMKYGAYYTAEAFVLPSHQENFGIVVAEALSCGTPALISDKVNIWYEVVEDDAGVVGCDDLEGTISVLEQWFKKSDDEISKVSKNALQCFSNRFEIKAAADSLIDIINTSLHLEDKGGTMPF